MNEGYKLPKLPSNTPMYLLEVNLSIAELEHRTNLRFQSGVDDLDWFLAADCVDEIVGPILVIKYRHYPVAERLLVLVDRRLDVQLALNRVKIVLHLDDSEISWHANATYG
jgi:hypothetical protein